MRISDWSSDVCSSDLSGHGPRSSASLREAVSAASLMCLKMVRFHTLAITLSHGTPLACRKEWKPITPRPTERSRSARSEEHTSELQSLMRISYAVFCLKKKKKNINTKIKQVQQTP